MTEMERELSAFASQRDFLKLVPLEVIPERYHWLRAASDDDIYFYVYRILRRRLRGPPRRSPGSG